MRICQTIGPAGLQVLPDQQKFVADPKKGSNFHRCFKCQTYSLAQIKVLPDLSKFCLVLSIGTTRNSFDLISVI